MLFVERPNPSYALAKHIHESFFGLNDNLSEQEIINSGVRANANSGPNHTAQLYARGNLEDRSAYQTLSLGRTGKIYLTTTHDTGGGDMRVYIAPNSAPNRVPELVSSLFMRELVTIANNRPE